LNRIISRPAIRCVARSGFDGSPGRMIPLSAFRIRRYFVLAILPRF